MAVAKHAWPFLSFPRVRRMLLVRNLSMAAHCKAGKNKMRAVKPNSKKLLIASEVRRVFENNNIVAVFQYGDMTTTEWDDLRFDLREQYSHVKVFPNKIACKALEQTIYKEISPLFLSTTCVVYSDEGTVKRILSIIKKQPKLELMGAKIDNRLMSRYAVMEYAKLPPLEEQYFTLVHYLSNPASRLSTLLCQNQQQLVDSLSRYTHQEQEELSQSEQK